MQNSHNTVTSLPDPPWTAAPMFWAQTFNETAALVRSYSPVTLNLEWPRVGRLLLMLFCCFFGSTLNGFFVASFFVEKSLRNSGNVYLACVGLADLVMTLGVTPVSAVVIVSGQWDNVEVCKTLQFIGLTSTNSYTMYFAFVAAENFLKICRPSKEYSVFLAMRTEIICFLIFCTSLTLSAVGVFLNMDYDYCERKHSGNYYFRIITAVTVQALPAILTLIFLLISSIRVRQRARAQIQYKRSHLYERDCSMTTLNVFAYFLFISAWTPYIIIVHEFPNISDAIYYNMVALGLIRSSFTSSIYGMFNRTFRRAYGHIFNYCCCKNALSSTSLSHRHRMEYKSTLSEVRVHIMHQAVTSSSLHRSSYWRTQEL